MKPSMLSTAAIAFALLLSTALSARSEQFLLYTPQPVASGQSEAAQDGVLVREITIQKGDTLYALSSKFSGHGMYYPQILLFNSIKDPNLIYAGNTLKVPVPHNELQEASTVEPKPAKSTQMHKTSAKIKMPQAKKEKPPVVSRTKESSPIANSSTELSLSDLKRVETGKKGAKRLKAKNVVPVKKNQPSEYPIVSEPAQLPATEKNVYTPPSSTETSTAGQKIFDSGMRAYRQDNCRTALEQFDRFLADNSNSPLAADANLYKAECYMKLSVQ